jgi:maltose-binding protein MalE
MYYNRDLLSTNYFVKPASTWEELETQIPTLVSTDPITGKVNQAAIALGSYRNISAPDDIISSLIMQSGGTVVSFENNRYVSKLRSAGKDVTKIPAGQAMDFFLSFSDPTTSRYSWTPSSQSARQAFLAGALTYYIGYASEYQELQKRNPNLNFEVTTLPQPKDARLKIQKGQVYGISMVRTTQKQALALAVMKMFGDAKMVSPALTTLGIAPVTKTALADLPSDAALATIYKSAIITKSWLVPGRPFMNELFRTLVNDIQSGVITESQALSVADAKLMGQYGSITPPPTQDEQDMAQ